MKPVELEIFLQDEVSPGLKKAGQTVQTFSNESKTKLREIAESLKVQRTVVKQLETQYKELEKSQKMAAPGQQWFEVTSQMSKLKGELDAEKAALSDLTEQQRKLKTEAENTGVSLRQQLRNVREEISTLLLAYRSLSEQEKQTAQGKQLAQYIDELTEKAGELNDAIGDTTQAIRNAASDTRSFDQLAGGVQLVVDGFGLATAGAQALGLSEASLTEIQTRLQTALVASNALSSMQVNLQKQSALMQGVNVIQTKAAAAAETIRTWAVGRGVIATKAAAIAQAAFNKVANANPYVILAVGVTTVVGALYAFVKGSDAAKKAEEERQEQIRKTQEQQQQMAEEIGQAAGSQIASYMKLKNEWDSLGDDLDKKRHFVDENKKAFAELGFAVNDVVAAETLLSEKTDSVIKAFVLRAKAAAYDKTITQAYQRMIAEQQIADVIANNSIPPKVKEGQQINSDEQDRAGGKGVKVETYMDYSTGQQGYQRTVRTITDPVAFRQGYEEETEKIRLKSRAEAEKKAESVIADMNSGLIAVQTELNKTYAEIGLGIEPENHEYPKPVSGLDPLEAARKIAEGLKKIRKENEQDEINQMADGAERRRRQIALDYEKEIEEIEKQQEEFARLNLAAGIKDVDNDGLTEEQSAEISRAKENAETRRTSASLELYKEEAAAMREYLKEYGSMEQRKLAITEEYEEKIGKALTRGDRERLEKEKEKVLSGLSFESISMGIDWNGMLSGVGSLSHEMMRPMLEQLEAYTKTDEYARAEMAEREKVTELIRELRGYIGTDKATGWEDLARAITDFTAGVARYKDLEKQERDAVAARERAKEQLERGEITQTDFDKISAAADELGRETAKAREEMRGFGRTLNETSDVVKNYVSGLTVALNKLGTWDGIDGFGGIKSSVAGFDSLKGALDSALPGMSEGIGKELGKGLSSALGSGLGSIGGDVTSLLSGGIGSVVGIIAQIPKLILDLAGSIKGMVTGVLDSMTELISLRWIDDLVNGILDSVGSLVDAIFDLPENLYHVVESIIVDGIGGLFNTILGRLGNVLSLGLLGSGGPAEWFTNSNAKEVQATMERLTDRNGRLQTAIEDLTDEIKASLGTKSVTAYRDAYRYQQETNENYLEMAQAQAGYHGSHRSWNYYWSGFSQDEIAKFSERIGRSWNGDIWNLSPEEMKMLRENLEMWSKIENTGKGGYGSRLTEKLDDYIAQAGKLEELTTQLYEGLTGISFDSLYDSFIDQLMDMEASTEDFADNISEYFMRAMLSNKIGEMYAERLEEWWNKFGKAMEDNNLTEAERNSLQQEYMQYVEEAIKLRDQLAAATGYGSDSSGSGQSGKPGSFNAMSQDQGTKLEGLFTSVQGHVANIDSIVEDVAAKMSIAEGYLAKIEANTQSSAKSASEIKQLIEKMIRDGLKSR
ncbi:hypothetical protein [uncultured Duncaniella sp.]|uniref:hypothetical protein n=1 Tax=uncultured Duncaniella sp. TaxID=2768039 RepID=UPI0025B6FA3E|nr:hypothetical protein [uncultured Duncaniella sp.]